MFYKPGFNVVIDMFQTEKQIKKQYQYQQNAKIMYIKLQQTKKESEIMAIKPSPYGNSKSYYKNTNYNKNNQYPKQDYKCQNNKYREK
jgi:hypothetical protein